MNLLKDEGPIEENVFSVVLGGFHCGGSMECNLDLATRLKPNAVLKYL